VRIRASDLQVGDAFKTLLTGRWGDVVHKVGGTPLVEYQDKIGRTSLHPNVWVERG